MNLFTCFGVFITSKSRLPMTKIITLVESFISKVYTAFTTSTATCSWSPNTYGSNQATTDESTTSIESNHNNQIHNTMEKKVVFNWANALVVFTTALTGTMSCVSIVENKVKFNTEKFVHDVLPLFVDGMLHCIEFPKEA